MPATAFPWLEAACLLIVVQFLAVRLRRARIDGEFGMVLSRLALLALSSFLAEDSVMHLYGFYQYAPSWWPFVDRLPLMIALIWPIVIHSAWDLARAVCGDAASGLRVAVVGALFVLADASLIEPVSVRAGLWSWNAPGIFAVPPIGILGWALFAFLAFIVLERSRQGDHRWLWTLPLSALGVHPLLLASWWGLFRWVSVPWAIGPAVAIAALLSISLTVLFWRRALRQRVPREQLLSRIPAALFFFVLLALFGRDDPLLIGWTLCFAPPYLALMSLPAQHHANTSS